MPKAAATLSLTLCAFRAAGFDAATSAGAPSRLVVAPMGTHDARSRGKVIVNQETLDGFAERQTAAKLGTRLALDFEHNTVPGTPVFLAEKEPRSIAAWATCSALPEGLVYHDIQWTPAGLDAYKNNLFQDISPAVFRRADGTVLALHSAALCRHGEIDGLTIAAASAPAQLAPFFAALSASLTPVQSPMKNALAKLLAMLGVTIAADAEDAAFETALTEGVAKLEPMLKAPEAMTAETSETITALTARLEKMEQAAVKHERAALIAGAAAEGKVIALSAEMRETCPLDVLKDHIKQLKPGVIPLTRTSPTAEVTGDKPDAFSAADLAIAKTMGLTEDDLRAGLGLPTKTA